MRLTLHGGFGEKGRVCLGVESGGTRLLLDAGVKVSARASADYHPALPRDALSRADALLVTHAHEDHVAALGWCLARGFAGEVRMSAETLRDSAAVLGSYATADEAGRVAALGGTDVAVHPVGHPAGRGATRGSGPPAAARLVPLVPDPAVVVRLGGLRLRVGRSGHIAGGLWCAIDDGAVRLLYCGDVSPASPVFAMDPLPECDAIVLDGSYGDDPIPASERAQAIVGWIARHPRGCVLPTPLYGRSLELLALAPGPVALAPGVREALARQLAAARWLRDDVLPDLVRRLADALDWREDEPWPRLPLVCHDAMGLGGPALRVLPRAGADAHPVLFTGHVPAGSPGERLLAAGRAHWIRLPTHPTLPENVALAAASKARAVLVHSAEPAESAGIARALPASRCELRVGDVVEL